jgi:lipopolysaccharide transport system ATP-binding protein
MPEPAIRIRGLGKRYRIGAAQRSGRTLRETATAALSAPFRRTWGLVRGSGSAAGLGETFWALRGIDVEIERGQAVGIVGRNGAGKSTLLKILSRITSPTEGSAAIHGRVGSLLEVGTGFHPELTGAENVYLNGAILGMKRHEIRRRFDEIVSFAELERFIETPVKLYSSGMYVRLAFAVAAHLDPDIMIIDEVLAVGDAGFQQKCLGRMGAVAREGRTVLFVSHNMAAIQQLTARALYIDGGRLVADGPSAEIVEQYLGSVHRTIAAGSCDVERFGDREGSGRGRVVRFELLDARGCPTATASFREPLRFRLTCVFEQEVEATFGVLIHSLMQEPLVDLRSTNGGLDPRRLRGRVVVEAEVPALNLYPGDYLLSPWIADRMVREDIDFLHFCSKLTILPAAADGPMPSLDPAWGKLVVDSSWCVAEMTGARDA